MADKDSSSRDVLGIRPLGEAVHALTQAAIDGVGAFLGRICLPAAEEIGELLRDRVRYWRAANALRIAQKAEKKLEEAGGIGRKKAHPRLAIAILETGSWTDTDEVQEMWAGLLASSCADGEPDGSNLMFINLLSQLTSTEARLLNFLCHSSKKQLTGTGLIWPQPVHSTVPDLQRIADTEDVHRLDREVDHLRSLDLIEGGIPVQQAGPPRDIAVSLRPAALALYMFVRSQGSSESPVDFFAVQPGAT